ncbi:MAG TPA: GNAT family N-acetyltransferase [Methylomirabilota bacterium]|nr:GNAT family N-acetyltransferase [Methylomirabilota bacterium]
MNEAKLMLTPCLGEEGAESRLIAGRRVMAIESAVAVDPLWDRFLRANPLGQFQQSGLWAQMKTREGWKLIRMVLSSDDGIVGGWQLLWKRSRLGLIGYVSKGPVVAGEDAEITAFALDRLALVIEREGLRAVIVQPPDLAVRTPRWLADRGYQPDRIMNVIQTNLVVDVRAGMPEVERRMSHATRRKSRQARRKGTTVREATESEIATFFRLMLETCRRQGEVRPNPSSVEALTEMWRVFHPAGCLRITLAECESKVVAGLLSIPFGRRMTLWKKGWNGEFGDHRPNELLTYEALEWAARQGLSLCDFGSVDRGIAQALREGKPLSSEHMASRTFFNLGFGAEPMEIPEAMIGFASAGLRHAYKSIGWVPGLTKVLGKWVKRSA